MKERVKITITPSVSDSNLLTVEDAMQHVLDYFDLLRSADKSIGEKETIVWRLKSVTTNSPFTVVAEPYGYNPAIDVSHHAAIVIRRFHDGIESVIHNRNIPNWIENDKHLQNTLRRNLNGIGKTDIDLGDNIDPIVISPKIAEEASKNLQRRKLETIENLTHSAYGSMEGVITNVSSYYGKPCFHLRPRISRSDEKDIRCIVSEEIANEIGNTHKLSEVWGNSRLIVEGLVSYDSKGEPVNIDVKNIIKVRGKSISLEDLYDEHFTNGMSVKEYQEGLREGTLDDN